MCSNDKSLQTRVSVRPKTNLFQNSPKSNGNWTSILTVFDQNFVFKSVESFTVGMSRRKSRLSHRSSGWKRPTSRARISQIWGWEETKKTSFWPPPKLTDQNTFGIWDENSMKVKRGSVRTKNCHLFLLFTMATLQKQQETAVNKRNF